MVQFPGLEFVQRNVKTYEKGIMRCHATSFLSSKPCPKVFRKIMLPVAFAPKEEHGYWSQDIKSNILTIVSDGQRDS